MSNNKAITDDCQCPVFDGADALLCWYRDKAKATNRPASYSKPGRATAALSLSWTGVLLFFAKQTGVWLYERADISEYYCKTSVSAAT